MRAFVVVVTLVSTHAELLHQRCAVGHAQRERWSSEAAERLRERGYGVSGGKDEGAQFKFAPMGTISNPDGTYGAVQLGRNETKYPGGDSFCRCLLGDVEVSEECRYLAGPMKSGGEREALCTNSFVLGPKDAVLLIACMPPDAEYFGWQTNVLSRWQTSQTSTGLFFPEVSMLNTINGDTINTTATVSESPFEQAFAVIVTADMRTAEHTRAALVDSGFDPSAINLDIIDATRIRLSSSQDNWLVEKPDALEVVSRVNGALLKPGAAGPSLGGVLRLTRFTEAKPATEALMIRDNSIREYQQHPVPELIPRVATGVDVSTTYDEALDALVTSIVTKMGSTHSLVYNASMTWTNDYGYTRDDVEEYLHYPLPRGVGLSPHFSTRDCLYQVPPFSRKAPQGEETFPAWASSGTTMLVIGVAVKKIGKAQNHNLFGSPRNCTPVIGNGSAYHAFDCQLAFDEYDLWGSAAGWAPTNFHTPELFDDLFVGQWARQCLAPLPSAVQQGARGRTCFEVREDLVPSGVNSPMNFVVRQYLDPKTRTGPSDANALNHRLLVFEQRPTVA